MIQNKSKVQKEIKILKEIDRNWLVEYSTGVEKMRQMMGIRYSYRSKGPKQGSEARDQSK